MTPSRLARIETLFAQASALAPVDRAAFLERLHADDGEAAKEVERLLANERAASDAFDQPLIRSAGLDAPRDDVQVDPLIGKSIGGFTILAKLGEGGMSVVYEAQQSHPHRTVALKLLRPGIHSNRLARRLEIEADVLGRLQHPAIAHVYEAGWVEHALGAQPYLAMELVRGVPVTDFVAHRELPIDARLELIAEIADAVHYAHMHGVIHRDLKPDNILIVKPDSAREDADATTDARAALPKVLDFGIAKLTESDVQATTLQTDVGQIMGTIPYMSPEQVAGDPRAIDSRTDVYSLGALAFEILTGKLPLDVVQKPLTDAMRIIREDSPRSPASVAPQLSGDIGTILLKALEKDRDRRYQSAAEFAADIRRALHHEPISARPASTVYRVRLFAVRHKGLVAACAAIAVTLLAATIVSTVFAIHATRAASLERSHRIAAERTTEFVENMLASVNPESAAGEDVLVRDVLDEAAVRIEEELADEPVVKGAIHHTIGATYRALGLYPAAETHLRQARDLRVQQFGLEHEDTVKTLMHLAHALRQQDRLDEAEEMFREADTIAARIAGRDDVLTLEARSGLAMTLGTKGEVEQSIRLLEDVLARSRSSMGDDYAGTISAMNNLAMALIIRGDFDRAEALYRESMERRREIYGHNDARTATALNNYGDFLAQYRKLADAEPYLREALAIRERVLGEEHPLTLSSMNNYAAALSRLDRMDEAEAMMRRVLDLRIRLLGERHRQTINIMSNLGRLLHRRGRAAEAIEMLSRTLELARDVHDENDPFTLSIMTYLGEAYRANEELTKAEPLLREAWDRAQQVLPPGHWRLGTFESRLAECLAAQQNFDEAETLLLAAHERFQSTLGPDQEWTAFVAKRLAELYEAWGREEDANRWRDPSTNETTSR